MEGAQAICDNQPVRARAWMFVFIGADGAPRAPGATGLAGYCIENSHACVGRRQQRGGPSAGPTCDVHVHDARAGPDAVGGVADVCPGQVVGHRALEEQGVVLDFHVGGERAVQAAKTEKSKWLNYARAVDPQKHRL